MQRLGLSLFFTNFVFHSSIPEISPMAKWVASSDKDSLSSVNASLLEDDSVGGEQSVVNSSYPGRTFTKCCPWGTTFDVNSLTCKSKKNSSRTEFLQKHLRDMMESGHRDHSFGIPKCLGTALYSAASDDLNSGLPEERCIDEDEGNLFTVRCGDPQVVCKFRPCIRKCKPFGEYYGEDANGTEEIPFSPVFYNLTTLKPDDSVTVSNFGILFGMDCEGGKIRLDNEKSDVNYLGTNGTLYAPGHREFQVFSQNEFCIEYVLNEGIFKFLCPPVEEERTESVESYVLLALGFIASCVCLFATLVVYLCFRMSKSLYGKSLMSYVGCLCIAYLGLAIVHLGNHYLKKGACVLLGYSILLSFLAAFFWLNVMSVDIWKTFRSLRATEWRKTPENRFRFTGYSLYAWGSSLTITFVCGILDAMPDSSAPSALHIIKPDIGSSSCWFSRSSYGMYIFFVAPVSLIITCNVVLYVNTAWRCWRVRADINKLGAHSGRSKGKYSVHRDQASTTTSGMLDSNPNFLLRSALAEFVFAGEVLLVAAQLVLNGKLFIVMGVSWGPEFISTVLPHPLWKITDAMNTLLGVFIFVIFVLKKKMINNMSQKVRDSLRTLSKKGESSDFRGDSPKRKKACTPGMSKNIRARTTNV